MDGPSRRSSRIRQLGSASAVGSSSASKRVGRGFCTIGLVEHFDHPELVVAGFPFGHASHVLEDLCELIRDGARFEVDHHPVVVDGAEVSFGDVHPVHIGNGLMNLWLAHAERVAAPSELRVRQALLDPTRSNLRLDRPYTTLGGGGRHPRRYVP